MEKFISELEIRKGFLLDSEIQCRLDCIVRTMGNLTHKPLPEKLLPCHGN